MSKTTIQATIEIDADAWRRVCGLASRGHRPLPIVIGDLLDSASVEPAPDVPKTDEPYEAPLFVRLFLSRHPEARPLQD